MWRFWTQRDEHVIGTVLDGHRDQFGVLVHRYLPVVQAIARAQLGAGGDVEDAAQEAFVRAYLNLDQLRERSKFAPWIAIIARHVAIDFGKDRARDQELAGAWLSETLPAAATPDLARTELLQAVRGELDQLEAADREVLLLKYFAGKRSREIAGILEISEAASRKRIERARAALGERLLARLDDLAPEQAPWKKQEARILRAILGTSVAWQPHVVAASGGLAAPWLMAAVGTGAVKTVSAVLAVAAIAVCAGLFARHKTAPVESPAAPPVPAKAAAAVPAPEKPAVATEESTPALGIPLRGRVLHTDGTPIPGAAVFGGYWAEKAKDLPEPRRLQTTSDEQGNFTLHLARPWDIFLVWADKDGYARVKQDQYSVTQSGRDGVVVTLYRNARIEGEVVNKQGVKLPSKPVMASWHSPDKSVWTQKAVADARGHFVVNGLLPGEYGLLIARHEMQAVSGVPERLRVSVKEGEALTGVRIVLDEAPAAAPSSSIAGHITAAKTGAPIEGAFVQLISGQSHPYSAHSDEKGEYVLEQIPDGAGDLHVFSEHYQTQHRTIQAGATDVDSALLDLGRVSGRVIDAKTQRPIAAFDVTKAQGKTAGIDPGAEASFRAVMNSEGRFELSDVSLEQATIIARAKGYRPAYEPVSLEAGERRDGLVIALQVGLRLQGVVVTSKGMPVSGAYVLPCAVRAGRADRKTLQSLLDQSYAIRTAADGHFTLEGLSSGKQIISAVHPDLGSAETIVDLTETNDNRPVTLTLGAGSDVTGVVRLGKAPQEGVTVMATAFGGLGEPYSQARTDAEGRYEIKGVKAGTISITAMRSNAGKPGQRRLQRDVTISDGGSTTVDMTFSEETGRIEGRVSSTGIEKAAGTVQCEVQMEAGSESYYGRILDGAFVFEEVTPGTATVMVGVSSAPENRSGTTFSLRSRAVSVEVTPGKTAQVSVVIDGRGAVAGHVSGLAPNEHGTVLALEGEVAVADFSLENMAALGPLARATASVGADGAYRVDGLAPGTYTLLAAATATRGPDSTEKARFTTATVKVSDENPEQTQDFELQ